MRSVASFEAKTHLSALIDEVAGGGEIVITRHGRPVARLVAPRQDDRSGARRAAQRIRADRGEGIGIDALLALCTGGRP